MESTVSGTDPQEGHHDTQPLTTSSAKIDTNLIETSRGSFIYTPAQLHEITLAVLVFPKLYSGYSDRLICITLLRLVPSFKYVTNFPYESKLSQKKFSKTDLSLSPIFLLIRFHKTVGCWWSSTKQIHRCSGNH